jgi:hypothetical protein
VRLTREERSALFHREIPRITRERKPCDPGIVIPLSAKLSIEVTAVVRTKAKLWRVDYTIRDDRPHLLRRVPTTDRPRKDLNGRVIEPDASFARIDSSYTTTEHLAVPDAGEAVDDVTLDRFTQRARATEAQDIIRFSAALESVLAALRERADRQPTLRRELWPLQREANRLLDRERRRVA